MSGSNIPPVISGITKPVSSTGQSVQIVSLPEALQNNARSIRLEGEVASQNKDGSIRIKTPEGDIDVVIRGRQPQVGAKVEIEIPAGSPPRSANLRPAPVQYTPPPIPAEQPPQTQTNAQPVRPTPQVQPQTPTIPKEILPQTYTKSLPVSQDTQTLTPAATKTVPVSLPPLEVGQTITLSPVPAPKNAPIPLQTSTPQTQNPRAPLSPRQPQATQASVIINSVITALKSLIPQQTPLNTAPAPQIISTPVPLPENLFPPTLVLNAKVISITTPSGQVFIAPLTDAPDGIQILQPQSQTQIQTPTTAAPSAQPITTTVSGATPQGHPVVTIPIDNHGAEQGFVLRVTPQNIPAGTQITIQPQVQTLLQTSQSSIVPIVSNITSLPNTSIQTPQTLPPAWRNLLPLMQPLPLWQSVDEIFQGFYQATPQAAQILGRIIPSPANTANFGPAAMLFIASIRAGELQNWIGDKKLEMIQKIGKSSALSQLSNETAPFKSTDVAGNDWRSFPLPLLWQNEISKIMLHVKKDSDENAKDGRGGNTRFILDISTPRMGDVQIDSSVHGKRLDVILRTQTPISHAMQDAMRTAYAGALDGSDVYGELTFQGDLKGWMNVIKGTETLVTEI